jgi:catechol-2,3-dioxygenase
MSSIRTVPTDRVVAPAKLAHVVLRTAHHDEAIAWYQEVLGARCVFRNPVLAFLTYDEEHHRLALVNVGAGAPAAPPAPGLEHVAFMRVARRSAGDLPTVGRPRSDPAWSVNHGPTTSMYYVDPDGNQVELQVDNFECAEDLLAWFRTDAFAENPIGVPFDPERLVAAYEAGTPDADLLAPPGVGGS